MNIDSLLSLYQQSIGPAQVSLEDLRMFCGVLVDFFRMYYQSQLRAGTVQPDPPFVLDNGQAYVLSGVIEYIRLHYTEDIRLEDIARFCRCSESYISHMFKKNMHRNLSRFVNEVRVEESKRLLAQGQIPVREVAALCGFSDPNYFSTVFKDLAGTSPTAYSKHTKAEVHV